MQRKFLLIASYPESLLNFRGPLLRSLLSEGLDVHVAAPGLSQYSKTGNQLSSLGVVLHDISLKRTGLNPLSDVITFLHFLILIFRVRPDFFLSYTVKPVIYGCLAAWLCNVPNRFALITGLGYAFQDNRNHLSFLKNLVRFLYKIALRRTDKIFFQNPDDKLLFTGLKIINASNNKAVVVNGSGVNLNDFVKTEHPKCIRFLLIARLLGAKGVREYYEAALLVKDKYPDVQFGLVGWIDESPDAITEEELEYWKKSDCIEFYGRLDDVRPSIAACSVFVLPSYREGTPRTVLEAMAMGRAIITTDSPGCRETVVNGKNGFLVPIKSVSALVQSMSFFINHPESIITMGNCSRKIAEDKYDVIKVNSYMMTEMGLI